MCIKTKLRTLRLEYGVSLTELAERGGVSNQLISRMELGDVPRTEHKEVLAAAALSGVIAARRASLDGLERNYQASKGQLLIPMEDNDHEL